MMIYCGQTRSAALVEELKKHGIGECTVRGELKSRRRFPWFYDNGAFRDWRDKKQFDGVQFERDMRRIRYSHGDDATPNFIILPDVVGAGTRSLRFSGEWWHSVEGLPAALAVQDGMSERDVASWLDRAESLLAELPGTHKPPVPWLFVGGTLPWKLKTAEAWTRFAHARNMFVHVGRVGTPDRLRWASDIDVDSIDSSLPLMHREHLDPWLEVVHELRALDTSETRAVRDASRSRRETLDVRELCDE